MSKTIYIRGKDGYKYEVTLDNTISELVTLGYTVKPPIVKPKVGQYWRSNKTSKICLVIEVKNGNVEVVHYPLGRINYSITELNDEFTLTRETLLES